VISLAQRRKTKAYRGCLFQSLTPLLPIFIKALELAAF
jgi:hypothetical protein